MFGEPEPKRGDKIGCTCTNCGEHYTHIERVAQDPPRSTMRCPDCHAKYEEMKEREMAAGTWHCSDDELRDAVIEAANDVGVDTWDENGTVHFYYEEDE